MKLPYFELIHGKNKKNFTYKLEESEKVQLRELTQITEKKIT